MSHRSWSPALFALITLLPAGLAVSQPSGLPAATRPATQPSTVGRVDPEIIAAGDWSEEAAGLRGRLVVAAGGGPSIVCTVSFTPQDREACAPGGRIYSALNADAVLREFIQSRLAPDGTFSADTIVHGVISRIMQKTATGLLLHEFGRIVPPHQINTVAVEHAHNVHPLALVEQYRRDDMLWEDVTPSGRELERQITAFSGSIPPHMPKWRVYLPGYFEYMFIRRSNKRLLAAMTVHDALPVLVECPWPTRAGPRRGGHPPKIWPTKS
jgi:hypothetical protein